MTHYITFAALADADAFSRALQRLANPAPSSTTHALARRVHPDGRGAVVVPANWSLRVHAAAPADARATVSAVAPGQAWSGAVTAGDLLAAVDPQRVATEADMVAAGWWSAGSRTSTGEP